MDRVRQIRKIKRSQATRLFNGITTSLSSENPLIFQVQGDFECLRAIQEQLDELDEQIAELLYNAEATEEQQEKEAVEALAYKQKYMALKIQIENLITAQRSRSSTPSRASVGDRNERRSFKLPKIELKTFSGELKDWLGFWSQFAKIHEDPSLFPSDKFQYLVMAMKQGTIAREIVESYPQTSENYPKAIEALKERYGNEDLLVQVYVRELLTLVISNAASSDKIPIQQLYLKIESHLRSLKTLHLANADPDTWIFPLVESSVPPEILLAWQRSSSHLQTSEYSSQVQPSRLESLMNFLRNEVHIQQKISLAQNGFEHDTSGTSKEIKKKHFKKELDPSLVNFQNTDIKKTFCAFCGKSHESRDCIKAQDMSIEEKKDKLRKNKCCLLCFKPRQHIAKYCKTFLRCIICAKRHQALMCPDRVVRESHSREKVVNEDVNSNATFFGRKNLQNFKNIVLQTFLVNLKTNTKMKTVRVFLDSGSQRSYILNKTAAWMNLQPLSEEEVVHTLFGGVTTKNTKHKLYSVTLEKLGGEVTTSIEVRSQPVISNYVPRLHSLDKKLASLLKKNDIWFSDVGEGTPEIEILIGADNYAKLLTGRVVKLTSELTAIETILGWTLCGEVDNESMAAINISMLISETDITRLWDLETIGVMDPIEAQSTAELEAEVKQEFFNSLERKEDGRYIARLPWKKGHPPLTSNRELAEKRLRAATRKLMLSNNFQLYDNIFNDWLSEGFIEEVFEEKREGVYYLPHRPVFKPESITTPVRPVFDASCQDGKLPSLNECLEKGSTYIQMIPTLLLRFREKKIGFTADIRKAFQMIEVNSLDRDFLRFLWWKDEKLEQVKIFRHVRVLFGATSSPFTLGAVLEYHLSHAREEHKSIATTLLESWYVDNCVCSIETEEDYKVFKETSINLLADAKMDLRMWMSNIDEHIEDKAISVLGLKWNRKFDYLFVDISSSSIPEKITKRNILSAVQKIFDPIGFTYPATIAMRILLQDAWVAKTKWDEVLPRVIEEHFKAWYRELNFLQEIKLPRLVTSGSSQENLWSLHTFTDASQRAYGASVILREETARDVRLHFLAAKARVAPLKKNTIPRLELLGCLIGAFITDTVIKALRLINVPVYYWTDSTTALAWIRRNSGWSTFVGNRVSKIRLLTQVENWNFVPGQKNHADFLTRGCTPSQLLNSRWWEGPQWLLGEQETWFKHTEIETDEKEVAKEEKKVLHLTSSLCIIDEVRHDHTYSQYIRIRAWTLRFIQNCRKKNVSGPLSDNEKTEAEISLIKDVQKEAFLTDKDLTVCTLKHPDGTLRVKTRILMRNDLTNFLYPFLLPKNHPLVAKLILEVHRNNCHVGTNTLISILREKFWIIQCRRNVQKIIYRCVRCQRFRAKPAIVDMAPLPEDRVTDSEPFQIIGVDLAGPLLLKREVKTWIVIFTCAVYRAVHFEVITSLNTPAFIRALTVFIKKYRRPDTIYSDNGTNFTGTSNYFKNFDWSKIETNNTLKPIHWKFNVAFGPWWGGMWERLIRTLKELLRRMVGKAVLSKNELILAVQEIADVMNQRPLTYMSEDPTDLRALTPVMFLRPLGVFQFPEGEILEADKMRIRHKYITQFKLELNMRFRKEYLSLLASRPERKRQNPLKVGDLVLIQQDHKKRVTWPLGRIITLIAGRDGVKRVAHVKTEDGYITRPVQRIYKLELDLQPELASSFSVGRMLEN